MFGGCLRGGRDSKQRYKEVALPFFSRHSLTANSNILSTNNSLFLFFLSSYFSLSSFLPYIWLASFLNRTKTISHEHHHQLHPTPHT
jgi:hypothetical protein